MAQKDVTERTLESIPEVFADIVNALLFDGDDIVHPEELTDEQSVSQYKISKAVHNQERDVFKKWHGQSLRTTCIGFENQTASDKDMAMRVISYDGASYRSQLLDKKACERHPVITLVLHFSVDNRWTAPRSLKDCLSIENRLDKFVSDYKINVFDLAWLTDDEIDHFKGDFKLVVEYLRAMRLNQLDSIPTQQIVYAQEVYDLFCAFSNTVPNDDIIKHIATKQQQGGVIMHDFLDMKYKEGIAIGEERGIAIGEERGVTRGIAIGEERGIAIGEERGVTRGIAIGEERGVTRGITRIQQLYTVLLAEGRQGDIERSIKDVSYLEELLKEKGM